ncbi:type II secretion system minor pseudopilin GspJ [Permianibacter sp. IMCC34836]|uniref:type II secretion system minor pseudopilin GspJ n=1 Tax=Permianibacter fluminis TaxID=2738515 RepID=UPI00155748CD|nr:type II secretion system minor pseudopilin GspJ [Permianibacter fluminis]NQD35668.1 type II secretion system minor pseudopilin GspJ [Permianibacter fluminis]
MKTARGFTLIEVLVAVLIFGLIGIGAYSTLDTAQDAQQILRVRGERFMQLQRAVTTFSRDYQQRAFRRVRDSYGDRLPVVQGVSDDTDTWIAFTRSGWRNPAQLPRSSLEHVRYALEEGRLIRYSYLLLDQAQQPVIQKRVLLDGISKMELKFRPNVDLSALQTFDNKSEVGDDWLDEWPVGGRQNTEDSEKAPRALKLTLEVEGIGEVHRVLQ